MSAALHGQLASLRPLLLRMAHRQLHDTVGAEDAVQDALIAVLEAPERFAGRSSLATYVIGIVKFKAVDLLRRRAREQWPGGDPAEALAAVQAEADPALIVERGDFFRVLEEGLAQIPEQSRRAFLLREWDGYDTGEVCRALGVSAANAYVLGHRARSHLKQHFETHW
ncbi:sigma-70 family RNA polymerase sigma factor [Pseudoduganella sp. FT25W]|uniref:Sigma-70 family RNA polymerase sigma factor n=1 Tax=Duganella alba TaxID=2666081 RepID=A0A6L5QQ34_9BURK|nr:sigma-70 family RNA polymerase sigma factor [Duganella alba]MRX11789.1 sigma-70 family RNA polymerase sigma factor [Duganella alba]MRX20288.1 sigma-70 family RNA polymerase sigma factor [Duganella alba]